MAQQSLFNVPSSEITERGRWFFQEQLNLSRSGVSNTTLDYGIGHGMELGLNLFDLDLYHPGSEERLSTLPMVNLQKRWDLTERWAIAEIGRAHV